MSLKKRLEEKLGNLAVPTPTTPNADKNLPIEASLHRATPKTAPGQMLAFRQHLQVHEEQVSDLQRQLDVYKGTVPTRSLDPQVIHPSRWANRHETHFHTPEFAAFKQEIKAAGGNIQPIKVRPLKDQPGHYEVVFGHRRHRACSELGLPVLALIEEMNEQDLFEQMERENRLRQDLSPWEQGVMYAKALDEKLYASLSQLGEAIGRDKSLISRALKLARLPEIVVQAFPLATELQYRWGESLSQALERDRDALLTRAEALVARQGELSSAQVFEKLLGSPEKKPPKAEAEVLQIDGQTIATWSEEPKGHINLRFEPQVLTPKRRAELVKLIQRLCQSR